MVNILIPPFAGTLDTLYPLQLRLTSQSYAYSLLTHLLSLIVKMSNLAPYASDHRDPNGPADARPSALKIIRDQNLDGELIGKVILITGGTFGIGRETTRALHATGADIYITGRDAEKGKATVDELSMDGKPGKIEYIFVDQGSLSSVRALAKELLQKTNGQLNCLICNAGQCSNVKADPY